MLLYKKIKSFVLRLDYLKIDKSNFPLRSIYFLALKVVNFFRWIVAFINKNKSETLNDFFTVVSIFWYGGNEGHTQQVQDETDFLSRKSSNVNSVLEIGFNGGHSSETFLDSSNDSIVDSIDIGYHHYVKFGNYFLKQKYGKRFNLFIGTSKDVLPTLVDENKKYDLIFIDGSHKYEDVIVDLNYARKLSSKDTLIILDDVYIVNEQEEIFFDSHNLGPTKAWKEMLSENKVNQIGYKEFESTNTNKRSIVYGKFI